jgi:hypothetical protein
VNVVSPSPISIPIYGRWACPKRLWTHSLRAFVSQIPLRRFGKPEEVAQTALFQTSRSPTSASQSSLTSVLRAFSVSPLLSAWVAFQRDLARHSVPNTSPASATGPALRMDGRTKRRNYSGFSLPPFALHTIGR